MMAACSPAKGPDLLEFTGATMGTTYSVKIAQWPQGLDQEQVASVIASEVDNVNRKMSTYQPDSELSRFNRWPIEKPFEFSADTFEVLTLALTIWRDSQGAFDITVGPLVNLWGFGPEERQGLPSKAAMAAAWARVGSNHLQMQPNELRVIRQQDVLVDLSAIAKGYAVDRVAEALEALSISRYLVEVGGEVRTGAEKAEGHPWRVAMEQPLTDQRQLHKVVQLGHRAMATSGDYRNFIELDGQIYSHTMDPRTGMPVSHRLVSVSVIADTCAQADAWATALMVLGPEEGLNIAQQQGLAVYMMLRGENGYEIQYSPGFEDYIMD